MDVRGSIRCSLSLVAGNIDVVARLLSHTSAISAMQLNVGAFSSTGFLQSGTYVTYVTGNLNIQAMKATNVILTPIILAPEENVELAIRNYWIAGGLSVRWAGTAAATCGGTAVQITCSCTCAGCLCPPRCLKAQINKRWRVGLIDVCLGVVGAHD